MSREIFLIERIDSAGLFFSEKLGRDWGNPAGGWSPDRAQATRFATHEDANDRVNLLGHMAPQVRVVPHQVKE